MTKSYFVWGTALVIALGSSIHPLKGQTWETILNYQDAGGRSIATDAAGRIIASGSVIGANGANHGTVLQTEVLGQDWFLSDDTNPSPGEFDSYIRRVGFDANGNMYSVGQLIPTVYPPQPNCYWYVRKSSDGGATWSTVDLYQYATGEWVNPTGFAADEVGNIYVAGWGRGAPGRRNAPGTLHWLVRKSSDGGQTWTLSDGFEGPTSGFGAGGAGYVPGAGIFVVGDEFTGGTGWRVRRSINGQPGTWATVDGPFQSGAASGVGSDSQGTIYVSGTMFITTSSTKKGTTGYYAWLTRKSIDGGKTWSTTDTFSYFGTQSSWAQAVGRDSSGNVVVAGFGVGVEGKQHWLVRRFKSGVWQTIDDFQLMPGFNAKASEVATDAAGNLLVTGNASDASGGHWIVRKLINP